MPVGQMQGNKHQENTKSMGMPRDMFNEIIAKGVAIDIFQAEEVLAIDELIGKEADRINKATFGAFFGSLQIILGRYLILAVNRVFEREDSRYQIRSIPSAIKFLRDNSEKLHVEQRPGLVRSLKGLGCKATNLETVSDPELTLITADFFSQNLPKPELTHSGGLSEALLALKAARDKHIAHNEVVDLNQLPKATYGEIGDLIRYAKEFLSTVGFGYLSIVYQSDEGHYFLSGDAERAASVVS